MHHPSNVKQMRQALLLSSNSRNPQGGLAGHGMPGQVSFVQPYRSAPRPGGLPQTPGDLPAHIPEMALAMASPARTQETRGRAKRRGLVTTFSHRLIPVVSVTRSPTAELADLRRHSDTCTSASNTFTNTLQIIRDGPTLLTEQAPPSTE